MSIKSIFIMIAIIAFIELFTFMVVYVLSFDLEREEEDYHGEQERCSWGSDETV